MRGFAAALVVGLASLIAVGLATAPASLGVVPAPRIGVSAVTATPDDSIAITASAVGTRPLRLYLAPVGVSPRVRSPFDARIHYVATVAPNARGRGQARFTVPPLESGDYRFVGWRPGSRARRVVVPRGPVISVQTPMDRCPITTPNRVAPRGFPPRGSTRAPNVHGTRLLATFVRGTYTTSPTGTFSEKLIWIAPYGPAGLSVTYRRLDAADTPKVAETIAGELHGFPGASWAARIIFTEGCWLVRGRTGDVSLSFVVNVVRG